MTHQKKEIKLNKKIFTNLFKSILISFIVVFVAEHFGEVNYECFNCSEPYVKYETFFLGDYVYSDTNYLTSNNRPKVGEVETYFEKLPYVLLAVWDSEDILIWIGLTIIIWIVFMIKNYYNIRIE